MDRNRSGFVEVGEAPVGIMRTIHNGTTTGQQRSSAIWVRSFDSNSDGKVSFQEYRNSIVTGLERRARTGRNCASQTCPPAH